MVSIKSGLFRHSPALPDQNWFRHNCLFEQNFCARFPSRNVCYRAQVYSGRARLLSCRKLTLKARCCRKLTSKARCCIKSTLKARCFGKLTSKARCCRKSIGTLDISCNNIALDGCYYISTSYAPFPHTVESEGSFDQKPGRNVG